MLLLADGGWAVNSWACSCSVLQILHLWIWWTLLMSKMIDFWQKKKKSILVGQNKNLVEFRYFISELKVFSLKEASNNQSVHRIVVCFSSYHAKIVKCWSCHIDLHVSHWFNLVHISKERLSIKYRPTKVQNIVLYDRTYAWYLDILVWIGWI